MSATPPGIDYGIIGDVMRVNDPLTLRVIEAIAHEKAKTFASGESEWIAARIAEKDERLRCLTCSS